MITNLDLLADLFKKTEERPYFVLSGRESADWVRQMRQMVRDLKKDLQTAGLKEGISQLKEIEVLTNSDKVDEPKLAFA